MSGIQVRMTFSFTEWLLVYQAVVAYRDNAARVVGSDEQTSGRVSMDTEGGCESLFSASDRRDCAVSVQKRLGRAFTRAARAAARRAGVQVPPGGSSAAAPAGE